MGNKSGTLATESSDLVPKHAGPATVEQGKEFVDKHFLDRKWRDCFFLILFLGCSACLVGLVAGSSVGSPFDYTSSSWEPLWVACITSVVWGNLWTLLTRCCAKPITYCGIFFMIFVSAIACYNFAYLALNATESWDEAMYWIWCALTGFAAVSVFIFFCTSRHKLKFTIEMLKISSAALMAEPLVYVLALVVVGLQIGGICLLLYGMETVFAWKGYEWLCIPMFFYAYWALWLVDGVMRTSIGGGMFVWYFMLGKAHQYSCAPILSSLMRACTKSLGSIAKGSFILALITMVISMLQWLENKVKQGGCLACPIKCCVCSIKACCMCFLSSAEWATEYAYIFIGAKGDNFAEAGGEVKKLLADFGVEAIMGEVVTRWISRLGTFLGVGFSIMIMYGWEAQKAGEPYGHLGSTEIDGVVFTCGVIVSYMIMSTLTVVTDCGTDSILVCYAIDCEQAKESGVTFAPRALTEAVDELMPKGADV